MRLLRRQRPNLGLRRRMLCVAKIRGPPSLTAVNGVQSLLEEIRSYHIEKRHSPICHDPTATRKTRGKNLATIVFCSTPNGGPQLPLTLQERHMLWERHSAASWLPSTSSHLKQTISGKGLTDPLGSSSKSAEASSRCADERFDLWYCRQRYRFAVVILRENRHCTMLFQRSPPILINSPSLSCLQQSSHTSTL